MVLCFLFLEGPSFFLIRQKKLFIEGNPVNAKIESNEKQLFTGNLHTESFSFKFSNISFFPIRGLLSII